MTCTRSESTIHRTEVRNAPCSVQVHAWHALYLRERALQCDVGAHGRGQLQLTPFPTRGFRMAGP